MQALFAWDLKSQAPEGLDLSFSWFSRSAEGRPEPKAGAGPDQEDEFFFARQLLVGTVEHISKIDDTIKSAIMNRDFDRIDKVDLSILRMSVFCLLYQPEMGASLVIDEAVCISREYGDPKSYRFINGVLDGIQRSLHGV